MNYKKVYFNLINKRINNKLSKEIYSERHHIIPKCMNGTDEKSNLVRLTAREHFIAHILLVKIYPKEHGLIKAVHMMCIFSDSHKNGRTSKNRMYGWLKEKYNKVQSEINMGKLNSQYGTCWICNLKLKENKKNKKRRFLFMGKRWMD